MFDPDATATQLDTPAQRGSPRRSYSDGHATDARPGRVIGRHRARRDELAGVIAAHRGMEERNATSHQILARSRRQVAAMNRHARDETRFWTPPGRKTAHRDQQRGVHDEYA